MECREVQRRYKDYLMGKLQPYQKQSMLEHMQDCADCFLMDLRYRTTAPEKPQGMFKEKEK